MGSQILNLPVSLGHSRNHLTWQREICTFDSLTGIYLTCRWPKPSACSIAVYFLSWDRRRSMRLHPGELWRSRPACFGKSYQDKWRPLDAWCPLDPCFKPSTPTCALKLWGKKGHKGSPPSWSHPPQITIYTRRLRLELSHCRENQQKKWQSWEKQLWRRSWLFALAAGATVHTTRDHLIPEVQLQRYAANKNALAWVTHEPLHSGLLGHKPGTSPPSLRTYSSFHKPYGRCRAVHLALPCLACLLMPF